MDSQSKKFLNPNNLPVEHLTLRISNSGVVQNVNALDSYWVDKKQLIYYERPPDASDMVFGAVDNWKSKMEPYLEYLRLLLRMEHHRFWSTIIHHPQCMDMLISYLQEADPPYVPPHISSDVRKLCEEIRKHVLIIFSRLVTNKESKMKWMSKEFLGDIIYNKFIFTVPVLWDICLAYGCDNPRHVSRLLHTVFELQPQYQKDVSHALAFVKEAFKYIILQVNKDYESEEPPNLPDTFKGFGEIKRPTDSKTDTISFRTLRDLVLHLLDTAMTLRIFVELYTESVELFKKCNFVLSIVQLYEYGVPQLYSTLEAVGDQTSVTYTEVEGHLDLARAELIDLFKEIVAVYKNAIFNREGNVAQSVESYLALMLEALSERLFIADYDASWPVHEDIDMLRQAYPDIDTVKTDFILQAIYSQTEQHTPEDMIIENVPDHLDNLTNGHIETPEPSPHRDNEIPDNVREESLISEVRDILPHLGDGFILKCLQHYGFNAERVINSVLEDTLVDSLRALDRGMPIIPEDPLDKHFLETGVERLNVFDGDQFDLMTRDDVDLSRIHVGKRRDKHRTLAQLLDDNKDVRSRADIYSKYNMVCEAGMYSDEYDDTYDSDGVTPAADGDDARRPFVTPRALQTHSQRQEESSEESSEEEQKEEGKSRMNFCVNPEEVRARRAAQFRAPRGHNPRPQPRNTDVTGKPKGQGQDKEVLANRDKKEKHKGARGNHNRRQGAQWKRSQAMMTS